MMKKITLVGLIFTLFIASGAFATVSINYVGGTPVGNIDNYTAEYVNNAVAFLKNTADGLAISNTVFPVFGDPHRSFVIGINGAATWILPNDKKVGKDSLKETDFVVAGAPFITIGLSENLDLTFKGMPSITIKKGSDTIKALNAGGVLRHRLLAKTRLIPLLFSFEGLTWSIGGFYSKNNFKRSETQSLSYQEYIEGVPFTVALHKVEHNVDTKNVAFDFEVKPFFNLLEIIDIFGGIGVSYNLVSEAKADSKVYTDISAGGNNYSGGYYHLTGTENGKKVILRYMAGIQINLGPIKLPVEAVYSKLDSGKAYSVSGGLAISF